MRIVAVERWESGKRDSVFHACEAGVFSTASLSGRDGHRATPVCLGSGQYCPTDPRNFVRETDGYYVRVSARFKFADPVAESGVAAMAVEDYRACAMYQQSAQVPVT